MAADLEAKAAVVSATAQVEQAQGEPWIHKNHLAHRRNRQHREGADWRPGGAGQRRVDDRLDVGDPIKVYYNVTEQAYINFTRLFSTGEQSQ